MKKPFEVPPFVKKFRIATIAGAVGFICLAAILIRFPRVGDLREDLRSTESDVLRMRRNIKNAENLASHLETIRSLTDQIESRTLVAGDAAVNNAYFYQFETDNLEIESVEQRNPEAPKASDPWKMAGFDTVAFNLTAAGTFREVLDLAYRIRGGPKLARLTALSLAPAGDGGPRQRRIQLTIEALAEKPGKEEKTMGSAIKGFLRCLGLRRTGPPPLRPSFFRVAFGLAALLCLAPSGTLLSASIVLPGDRRIEFIETLREKLSYDLAAEEELRLLPDPFAFGREIEEEKKEPAVEGLTDEELLDSVATVLGRNIIGYQDFNDRSFFATKDFGLLRENDTLTLELPDAPNLPVTIRIVNPDQSGFTIQLEDLELFIPANSTPDGVQPSQP